MDYSVKKLTPSIKFDQNGTECVLFSKKWSGVSIFEIRVCQILKSSFAKTKEYQYNLFKNQPQMYSLLFFPMIGSGRGKKMTLECGGRRDSFPFRR